MTQVFFIRHGSTDSADKRLTGWSRGVHLNARGQAQAEALPGRLARVPLEAIYSSPLERALETALPLATAKGLKVRQRHGLIELNTGEWTGRSLRALARLKHWRVVQTAPSVARFPGGESLREAQARAVAELEALQEEHPKGAIAVVSHGDIIKLAIAHYAGLHIDLFQRLVIAPGSISLVHFDSGSPRIVRLNDVGAWEDGVARSAAPGAGPAKV